MALDFPAAPAVGDKYPAAPTAGQAQYAWDGEKWTTPVQPNASVVSSVGNKSGDITLNGGDMTTQELPTPRYDAYQTTTPAQRTVARQNIYAAPIDVMAYSGMQMNGGFEISQQYGDNQIALVNAANYAYFTDGWTAAFQHATAQVAMGRGNFGINAPQASGVYFPCAAYLSCGNPVSPVAANDNVTLNHLIEGYRTARLGWGAAGAQPITVGFWLWAQVAGHATLSARNATTYNRSYCADINYDTPNIWKYFSITIPGCTDGIWGYTNGVGLSLSWCFASGATYQQAAGAWSNVNAFSTPAQTNFLPTNNRIVYLTGVTVIPGIEGIAAANSSRIIRSYDVELPLCQRQDVVSRAAFSSGAIICGGQGYLSSSTRDISRQSIGHEPVNRRGVFWQRIVDGNSMGAADPERAGCY